MKFLLVATLLAMLTACSNQTIYSMMHERERQECLKDRGTGCPRAESYEIYEKQYEEIIKPANFY